MAKRDHLMKLLEEKKRREKASELASVAAAAQAVQSVPAFPISPAIDDGDITGHEDYEDGFTTPPTNGSKLPGSPHGPMPPSPTSPASTFPGEPEAVECEKPIEPTKASIPRPVATPSRVVGHEKGQDQENQVSSDYYLHESQDAQVWSLKQSRKKQPVHPDVDDTNVSEDPYAPTLMDTATRAESEEPRL